MTSADAPLTLRRCSPADVPRLAAMRRARERWMEERGVVQWAVGSLDTARIHDEVSGGEWYALDGGGPADPGRFEAAVRLVDEDPLFWCGHERAGEPALYAHGLMTDPAAAGRGLGARVLDLAGAEAVRRSRGLLRLDCAPHLLPYYRPLAFTEVGVKDFPAFRPVLLARTARSVGTR